MRRVGRTKKGGPSLASPRKFLQQELPPYKELLLLLLVLLGHLLPFLLLLLQRGFLLLGYFLYSLLGVRLIFLFLCLISLYRPQLGFLKLYLDIALEKENRKVYQAYQPQQSLVLLSFLQVFGFLFQEKTKDVLFFLLS